MGEKSKIPHHKCGKTFRLATHALFKARVEVPGGLTKQLGTRRRLQQQWDTNPIKSCCKPAAYNRCKQEWQGMPCAAIHMMTGLQQIILLLHS